MWRLIDLTKPIYNEMPIYPGDPEVSIRRMCSYKDQGYIIQKLSFGNHTGTHIDLPLHMIEGGKSGEDYPVGSFFGLAVKFVAKVPKSMDAYKQYHVVILDKVHISEREIAIIVSSGIKIVGLVDGCDIAVPMIKKLLQNNILVVNDLINLDLLPKSFYFSAFPLLIKHGDGSPVRAVAYLE